MGRRISFKVVISVFEGNDFAERHDNIPDHAGIRILIDRHGSSGMGDKDETDPILRPRFLNGLLNGMRDVDEIGFPLNFSPEQSESFQPALLPTLTLMIDSLHIISAEESQSILLTPQLQSCKFQSTWEREKLRDHESNAQDVE